MALVAAGLAATATGAGAAVPNKWGFALVNLFNGTPDPAHQAGSWPAGFNVTVTSSSVGRYTVKFPQIGTPRGIVHVTAITQTAVWCQVQGWGPSGSDELVIVQCYHYGGAPVDSFFTILFEESSGTASPGLGYVHWNGSAIGSTFNSAGGVNAVAPTGVGTWTVILPGIGSTGPAGGIQVTAVDPLSPARCKVGAWAPLPGAQRIQVRCHNATNVPFDTGWNLTYQFKRSIIGGVTPPQYFGYTFDNTPANPGPYMPGPPDVTFNSVGSFNEIQTAGTGQRMVTFHKIGLLRDHVQVTAFGTGPEYCNLVAIWGTWGMEVTVRNVICYQAATRLDHASMVSYTSAV
ncbi:hypothetical protein [Sphaerisporangium aureirubrum]|uniref:CBM2 domain-containing protein n=1 Tax=Sphaerisporangium aureirubrum TaxID=1544736 RepID=A0ABW1NUR7_9ACTN